MKAVVSEKGQVTIPKRLRDSMGIKPGQTLDFEEERGTLVIRKARDDHFEAAMDKWYGLLKDKFPGWTSDQLLEDIRGPILPGELPDTK